MRRRTPSLEEPRRATEQRAGTYRENAARAGYLLPDPGQHFGVLHQGFLPESAGDMKHIELWRIRQRRVRRQPQPLEVAYGLGGLAVEAVGRVRNARQHFERSCQVDLVEALKQQGTDLQMGITRDHGALLQAGIDKPSLSG